MRKLKLFFLIALILSSCNTNNKVVLHSSIEKAIEYGIKDEEVTVLTEMKVGNTTVVLLLKSPDSVAIASVTTIKDQFKWYGPEPFVKFEERIYVDYKSEDNNTIALIIGKVSNVNAKKVHLEDNGSTMELNINNGYYMGIHNPDSDQKIVYIE